MACKWVLRALVLGLTFGCGGAATDTVKSCSGSAPGAGGAAEPCGGTGNPSRAGAAGASSARGGSNARGGSDGGLGGSIIAAAGGTAAAGASSTGGAGLLSWGNTRVRVGETMPADPGHPLGLHLEVQSTTSPGGALDATLDYPAIQGEGSACVSDSYSGCSEEKVPFSLGFFACTTNQTGEGCSGFAFSNDGRVQGIFAHPNGEMFAVEHGTADLRIPPYANDSSGVVTGTFELIATSGSASLRLIGTFELYRKSSSTLC